MRFAYRLVRDKSRYVAECVESDAVGEGTTANAAIASLRASLQERMFRPDAVAPPSEEVETQIELVLLDTAMRSF
jgi:hypothetical protein